MAYPICRSCEGRNPEENCETVLCVHIGKQKKWHTEGFTQKYNVRNLVYAAITHNDL